MQNQTSIVGLVAEFGADAKRAKLDTDAADAAGCVIAYQVAEARYAVLKACLFDTLAEAFNEGCGPAAIAALNAVGVTVVTNGRPYADPRTLN